jgi:hypothetical protein
MDRLNPRQQRRRQPRRRRQSRRRYPLQVIVLEVPLTENNPNHGIEVFLTPQEIQQLLKVERPETSSFSSRTQQNEILK